MSLPATLSNPRTKLAAAIGITVAALVWPAVQFSEGRDYRTYLDVNGVPTACDGATGSDIKMGQVRTEAQCDELLASNLMKHDADIERCIHVPMTDGQHAAFLSFAYNVGATKFCHSTMNRKLNSLDYAGACSEFDKWTYAGGKQWNGLVKRRQRERAMCEGKTI
jgi:lysozyme